MFALKRYEAGDIILQESSVVETAYLIERGKVELSKDVNGNPRHVAYLEAGQTFGEMNLVTDSPQKATAIALEPTWVHTIARTYFFDALRTEPDRALILLQSLFAYLRDREHTNDELIVPIQQPEFHTLPPVSTPLSSQAPPPASPSAEPTHVVLLEGLNRKATTALPTSPFRIHTFPFSIGRESDDSYNDLNIRDSRPWQVSKQHLSIVQENGRIGVMDRGSRLGSLVDGRQIGGHQGDQGPVFFKDNGGELVLRQYSLNATLPRHD